MTLSLFKKNSYLLITILFSTNLFASVADMAIFNAQIQNYSNIHQLKDFFDKHPDSSLQYDEIKKGLRQKINEVFLPAKFRVEEALTLLEIYSRVANKSDLEDIDLNKLKIKVGLLKNNTNEWKESDVVNRFQNISDIIASKEAPAKKLPLLIDEDKLLFSTKSFADASKLLFEGSEDSREVFSRFLGTFKYQEVIELLILSTRTEIQKKANIVELIEQNFNTLSKIMPVNQQRRLQELYDMAISSEYKLNLHPVWKNNEMNLHIEAAIKATEDNKFPIQSIISDDEEINIIEKFSKYAESNGKFYAMITAGDENIPQLKKVEDHAKKFFDSKIIGQKELKEKLVEIVRNDEIFGNRTKPEILYLMGLPGTGKDTGAEAFAEYLSKKIPASATGSQKNFFYINGMTKEADVWKILGSNTGYVGSSEFPIFLEWLAEYSGGRYIISGNAKSKKISQNKQWKGENLPGFKTPDEAVLYLDEFHGWTSGNKDELLKKALETGRFTINNAAEHANGLTHIEVPVNIIMASNDGIGLVASREIDGSRYGRPLTYDQSHEMWEAKKSDKDLLKETVKKSTDNSLSGSKDAKGISEEVLNRLPNDRFILMEPLSPEQISQVAEMKLEKLTKRFLQSKGDFTKIEFKFDDGVKKFIQEYHFLAEESARPVESKINSLINNTILDAISSGDITPKFEGTLEISVEQNKNYTWNMNFISTDKGETKKFSRPILQTLEEALKRPLTEEELEKLFGMSERMKKEVFGAEEVIDRISKSLLLSEESRVEAQTLENARKATAYMFLGPTATGKTELAKVIAKEIVGSRDDLVVIDFNGVTSIQDMKDLILGNKDNLGRVNPSEFMKAYDRKNGHLVFVFDEVANAPKEVLKALYQVLDEATVSTFSDGKERIMSNVTIILTGNAGEEIYEMPAGINQSMQRRARKLIYNNFINDPMKQAQVLSKYFSEAFLGRMSGVFHFPSHSYKSEREMFNLKLMKALKNLKPGDSKRGWNVKFATKDAYTAFAENVGKDAFKLKEQGRSIEKYIETDLVPSIRETLLRNKVKSGSEVVLNLGEQVLKESSDIAIDNEEFFTFNLFVKGEKSPLSFTIKTKPIDDDAPIVHSARYLTALHESGHELTRHILMPELYSSKGITVIPGYSPSLNSAYAGLARSVNILSGEYTRERILKEMAVLHGGHLGEELTANFAQVTAGKSNDIQRATAMAEKAILKFGLSENWNNGLVEDGQTIADFKKGLSELAKQELENEVNLMLEESEKIGRDALLYNMDLMEEMGLQLVEKGDLTGKEIDQLYLKYNEMFPSDYVNDLSEGDLLSKHAKRALKQVTRKDKVSNQVHSKELRENLRTPSMIKDIDEILRDEYVLEVNKATNYDIIPYTSTPEEYPKEASAIFVKKELNLTTAEKQSKENMKDITLSPNRNSLSPSQTGIEYRQKIAKEKKQRQEFIKKNKTIMRRAKKTCTLLLAKVL